MGRRPDPNQAAKGNPNRRKSANAKRDEEALRIAKLLEANSPADISQPPKMIDQGPLYAAAVTVWKEMAPRLARTQRLGDVHKPIFAMFCVYYADWVRFDEMLKREGETQTVKTVSGDTMIRTHPAVRLRDKCFENVMKLSGVFGLTPVDEYELFRKQSLASLMSPGLFGDRPQAKASEDVAPAPVGPQAGMLGNKNSAPPTVQ